MDIKERLQDRLEALKTRKQMAKSHRKEIDDIAKKLQQGAEFRDHRGRLQELALDSGECDYWAQEIEKQIEELQEENDKIEQHTPLDRHLAVLGRR